ncbi:MAG: hydrogenase expression/formation protein HypE [Bacteroidales bacterium]|nr:hydrogenase expression/formation protein HypE [Bacteroidales bacterium]
MTGPNTYNLQCPIPKSDYEHILLAHGGGGKLTQQLIEKMFYTGLGNELLEVGHDGALLPPIKGNLAFTTDSFVVDPIFFPGGDIGDLAINGTVNDLVCCGAKPLYISLAFILEEGFLLEELWKVVQSIGNAALTAGVKIVTGDTKVVERGHGDKIFINTSGIGVIPEAVHIDPSTAKDGDLVIINGSIGDHGVAVMSAREGLEFESPITSDTAALNGLVDHIFKITNKISVLRDPTRGGVATTLCEISDSAGTGIVLEEKSLPVSAEVRGVCEILGLDPLYIANEGKILIIVPRPFAEDVLAAMKQHPLGRDSAIIGRITNEHPGVVRMITSIGSSRVIDMLSAEQLPRIC